MADALLQARAAETKIQALYEALKGAGAGSKGASGSRDEGLPDALKKGGSDVAASTVNAAEEEIGTIAARAQRLLDQAQGRTETEATLVIEKLAVLASQDKSGRVADLTGLMTKGEGKRSGGERRALPGDPASNLPAGATNPPAVSDAIIANAVPGRRIMGEGAQKPGWLFVDSWYVVGPFPNPNRQNLRTRFGPEEGVDLDAQFQGAGGQPIRWKFWQTNSPRVVPPNAQEYAIYYLFTELYSDRARDLWLVIGSDDQSNLWVNEQLVWMSSDQLKGWQVGEGLRRVRLKQGRNRILLRLENGWRGTDTSLLLSLTK